MQTLWHALRAGGAYIVEDVSENYIEKQFGKYKRERGSNMPIHYCPDAPEKSMIATSFDFLQVMTTHLSALQRTPLTSCSAA